MNPLLANEQETYKILDLRYNSDDYTDQETIDYDTASLEDTDSYQTSNSGGTSLEDMIGRQQSGDNVYFDPLFQVLNDQDRNEISSPTLTTQRYQEPTFIFNSKTSSPLPTMTTTTTTTTTSTATEITSTESILLTTLLPASPLA